MKLVVGLGNPGEQYDNTRHNIGFHTLDELLKDYEPLEKSIWQEDRLAHSLYKKIKGKHADFIIAKPLTYMNNSGMGISSLLGKFKLEPKDLIIIYDELDLPLGKVRIRFGGASGGHRGTQSVIDTLKTDEFLRIRMGIGIDKHNEREHRDRTQTADFVLSYFTPQEKSKVKHMVKEVHKSLDLVMQHGIELYFSKFHKENNGQ